jgi:hypothetical protein
MSDFFIDIEELIEALAENNITPLFKLFTTWNLDITSEEDWTGVQDAINNFMENN